MLVLRSSTVAAAKAFSDLIEGWCTIKSANVVKAPYTSSFQLSLAH
jgi:hypothetical protein